MNAHLEALGWTLLHSLWLGAVCWIALEAALAWPGLKSPRARGRLAGAALALFVVAVAGTYGWSVARGEEARTERSVAAKREVGVAARVIGPVMVGGAAEPGVVEDGTKATQGTNRRYVLRAEAEAGAVVAEARGDWRERLRPVLPWLVGLWAAGVVFGLIRQARGWAGLRRLRRAELAPLPAEWAERFAALCARCAPGMRMPRIGETALARVPQVVGGGAAAILLPVGFLAGLSPAQAEAILAHELAHLVRRDFWLNALQALAEALFFFHPAVFAMSGHIRRERERACDDFAVERTGDALGYAKALATLAGAWPATPALAADGHEPGDLASRIGRVLGRPARRARGARLAPGGLLVFAAAMAVYAALFAASPKIVAQVLTPEERVEAVKAAVAETLPRGGYSPGPKPYPEGKMKVISELRTEDGSPAPEIVWGMVETMNGNTGGAGSFGWKRGRAERSEKIGVVSLIASHEDWAPVAIFDVAPAAGATELVVPTMTLRKGVPLRVRLRGEDGEPLAGVEVRGVLNARKASDFRHWISKPWVTDAEGTFVVTNADPAFGYVFEAKAEGRQNTKREVADFKSGETVEWVLSASRRITGRVVDRESGAPLAGATVHLSAASGTESVHSQDLSDPPLTTTDEDGRFTVPGWDDAGVYVLRIAHAGHASVVERARSGDDLKVALMPGGYRISGRFRVLAEGARRKFGIPGRGLSICRSVDVDGGSWIGATLAECSLTPQGEGEYRFEATALPDGAWYVSAIGVLSEANLKLKSDRDDLELVLDDRRLRFAEGSPDAPPKPVQSAEESALASGPVRALEIVAKTTDGGVVSDRRVRLAITPANAEEWGTRTYYKLEWMRSGIFSLPAVPVGATVYVDADVDDALAAGYWFRASVFTMPAGECAYRHEIEARPAGAVTVTTLEERGLALNIGRIIWIEGFDEPPTGFPRSEPLMISGRPNTNRATFPRVPLGGKYRVVATAGARVARSDWFTLDAARPVAELTVRFAPGEAATARVRLPDESAAADMVVALDYLSESFGQTRNLETAKANAQGEASFTRVSVDPTVRYVLRVKPERDWRPEMKIVTGARPEEWRLTLTPGLKIEGRVTNAAGAPVPDVRVVATPVVGEDYAGPSPLPRSLAEAPTDADGRFRFSTLPGGRVKFFLDDKRVAPGTSFPELELPAADGAEVRIVVE